MSELEALPPDLRALLADERDAYADDPAVRAKVMRRIEASVAFGAVGVAAGAVAAKTGVLAALAHHAKKRALSWIALSFCGGIVLGETHARLSAPRAPAPVTLAASATTAATAAPMAVQAPATDEPTAIPVSKLPTIPPPPPSPVGTTVASAAPSSLAAEQALIDTARSALSRGRAADALVATDDHARRFPRGRLAEEREILAIQALLLAGRRSDADARGERFHRTFPGSLYGNAVDGLLAPPQDGGR
jgi:hypothetical protein